MEAVLAQAHESTRIDHLTFLPNRLTILRELQSKLRDADRTFAPVSLLKFCLDNYEFIVEKHRRSAGDNALRAVAEELRKDIDAINNTDIGHFFGEEFLIIMPNTSLADACKKGDALCQQIRNLSFQIDSQTYNLTISAGVATYKIKEESVTDLLNRIDKLMYHAKNKGGDHWIKEE
jgi:diguanylate cyclase (GGDEF)-like protein